MGWDDVKAMQHRVEMTLDALGGSYAPWNLATLCQAARSDSESQRRYAIGTLKLYTRAMHSVARAHQKGRLLPHQVRKFVFALRRTAPYEEFLQSLGIKLRYRELLDFDLAGE